MYSVAEGKICGGNEFTITDSNGTFIRCLRCETCHPGFGLEPRCGESLQDPPNVSCHPCKAGTFSSEHDSSSCKVCHQCAKGESVKEFCSYKSDTKCSGKCEKGFYLRKKAPHNCQKCSTCCSDEKDEKIQECIDQGLNEQCSPRPDKINCGSPKASGSGVLSTTTIIVIGVSATSAIVIAIVVAYMCYRRRKRNAQPHIVDHEAAISPESVQDQSPAKQKSKQTCKLCQIY